MNSYSEQGRLLWRTAHGQRLLSKSVPRSPTISREEIPKKMFVMIEAIGSVSLRLLLQNILGIAMVPLFRMDRFSLEGETMSRRLGMVCAAALLQVAVGCSAGSFLLSWVGSGGKRQVVTGSVNDVAARLQASLGKLNIIVAVNTMDADTVKLNGQTKSGQRFALVLKRQMTSHGENTAISIEWEKDADEEFWGIVLDLLLKPMPPDTGVSSSTSGVNPGR